MKKSTVLNYLFVGYQSVMDKKEYEELKDAIIKYDKEKKFDNSELLASNINNDFPQFSIMHQAYVRATISKMASNIGTIKTIMIVYLVATILAAIIILAQVK